MARVPITTGPTASNPSGSPLSILVDTEGQVKAVTIQNVSATEFWASEDANRLQQVNTAGQPQVGLHFQPDSTPPFMLRMERFNGKLYARAQAAGALAEVILNDIC